MTKHDEAAFLKDVTDHQMTVLRDDDLYRHIRFQKPGTGCMHFDLVTYPGYLVYSGDMGCYVFSRLEDMFEFFRADRAHSHLLGGLTLAINPGYWSEKLSAVDGNRQNGSATEFSKEKFRRVINEYRVVWMRECKENRFSKSDRRELWDAVEQEVLWRLDDDHHAAMTAAHEFSYQAGKRTFAFNDLWDHNFTEYTYRFVWCCYALAWGIGKYDELRNHTVSLQCADDHGESATTQVKRICS